MTRKRRGRNGTRARIAGEDDITPMDELTWNHIADALHAVFDDLVGGGIRPEDLASVLIAEGVNIIHTLAGPGGRDIVAALARKAIEFVHDDDERNDDPPKRLSDLN